jgi:thiamine-monophosphate kinase
VTHLSLGPGPEFDRIRAIAAALGPGAAGLGDDCALIPGHAGSLALSVDLSVEGVHFRRDWLSLEEIGWRSAAAALSDLAAEGAAADGIAVALAVPPSASPGDVTTLMRGAGAAAASVGATVQGGDLSSGPVWSVGVTVWGRVTRPVTRAGARPGDGLWITGALGGARLALEAWTARRDPSPAARAAFARPTPRIAAGQWLAAHGATAMLDLSDGLAADARHLAAASEVAALIDLESLPRAEGVADPAFAAEGGEDYELLAALPAGFDEGEAFGGATGVPLTRVGTVQAGAGVRFTLAGRDVPITGFQHFR